MKSSNINGSSIIHEETKRLYSKCKESKVYEGDTLERYIMFQTFNNYYNECDKFDVMNTPCVKFINRHEDVMGGDVKGNESDNDSDDAFIGDVNEGMKEIKFDKEGSVGKIKEMDVLMKRKEMFMFMKSDNMKAMRRRQNKSVDFVLVNNGNNVNESNVNDSYYKTNLFTVYNGSSNNNHNNYNDKYSIQSMSTFSTRK